jgi:hypothetical protein
MIVLLLGRILDLDRLQAGLGDPQRIGPVILAAPPDRQVVGSAELLQEIFLQKPVDHLLCSAAFEVCWQNCRVVSSLRSRR